MMLNYVLRIMLSSRLPVRATGSVDGRRRMAHQAETAFGKAGQAALVGQGISQSHIVSGRGLHALHHGFTLPG